MSILRNPMQPLYTDEHETIRFKDNKIVIRLLEYSREHGFGLNEIAQEREKYSIEDREQFYQLIGYSLCGFSELSDVRSESYCTAERMCKEGEDEKTARIIILTNLLNKVRDGCREAMALLFDVHPDDLKRQVETIGGIKCG